MAVIKIGFAGDRGVQPPVGVTAETALAEGLVGTHPLAKVCEAAHAGDWMPTVIDGDKR